MVRMVVQCDMWCQRGRANYLWLMLIWSRSQLRVILRASNTVSTRKWRYKLQNIALAVPLDPLASYLLESMKRIELAAKTLVLFFSQSLINAADMFLPLMMIRSWSSNFPCFWATQILKSDPTKGVCVLMSLKCSFSW